MNAVAVALLSSRYGVCHN